MLQAGSRGLRIFRKGGDLQMGFPGTREGGRGGGGNGAILGISKAPVRQEAGLMARKLLAVNVCEEVMWPA